MYGYGTGWWWMALMPVLWLALIAVIVWAIVRLTQRPGREHSTTHVESPEEILDRRFARGEIDEDGYVSARDRLAGHRSEAQ